MPFDTSMYQNYQGGTGLAALAQGLKSGIDIANQQKQMKMQAERQDLEKQAAAREQSAVDAERRKQLFSDIGQVSGNLLSIKDPQQQQAEYQKTRENWISTGLAKPQDLPEDFQAARPMAEFYNRKYQQSQQQFSTDQRFKEAQIQKALAEAQKDRASSGGISGGKTEGIKALDKDFAKDYNEWTSGSAKMARSEIFKLQNVVNSLKSGDVTTGGLTGVFPDRMTSSKVLGARSDVQSTVMNSLRSILGAQFTEKEGERIIKNTWNESDTTENNVARLERLVRDLSSQADDKDKKAFYFQKNGTLSGFSDSGPFQTSQQQANQNQPINHNEAVRWARANPRDPRAAEILRRNGIGGL